VAVSQTSPPGSERRLPSLGRHSGVRAIWTLNALIFLAATLLLAFPVAAIPHLTVERGIPLLAFAAICGVAELLVVHLHFVRNAHSFSMSEVALVMGLFTVSEPVWMVIAQAVGVAVALAVVRHQAPIRLAFNVGQFALSTSVALLVFHRVAGPVDAFQAWNWIAAVVAVAVSAAISAVLVSLAIGCNEGSFNLRTLPRIITIGFVSGVANATLGIVACMLLVQEPLALLLVAIPVMVMYLSYRAYGSERKKHESIELLYESSSILNESRELDAALVALLTHARKMFRADVAELLLPSIDEGARSRRTRLGPGDAVEIMRPVQVNLEMGAWRRAGVQAPILLVPPLERPDQRALLAVTGHRDAMFATLRGEGRLLGALVVGDRLGEVSRFDAEDLRLFGLLANHVAVALENGRLERSLAQLVDLERRLSHQALHDPLTGLGNRTLFHERVSTALGRRGRRSAVVFIDLDDFKTINDSLGHAAGDRLLTVIAARIASTVRPSDTTARLGGDEFGLLLDRVSGPEEAEHIAARLLDTLRAPIALPGAEVVIGASVGVAMCDSVADADEALRNADVAMYVAKARGKACVDLFEDGMHREVVERLEMIGDLRHALETDDPDLYVHYQPVVSVETGEIIGFEALSRWRRRGHGTMRPERFVQLAEESGLVVELERRVLATACSQLVRWLPLAGPAGLTVSVNLSPRHLQQAGVVSEIARLLEATGCAPEHLVLELTESVLMGDTDDGVRVLEDLKALGVRVAIDDFGTGYSSLARLQRMPVDIVKIDRSFIERMAVEDDEVLVRAIVTLASQLGLTTVAEGVETPDQLERLRDLGCLAAQGFLFSPPCPAPQAATLLGAARPRAGILQPAWG
jgi:diguanylate cyclase (GGDEF)-like protein